MNQRTKNIILAFRVGLMVFLIFSDGLYRTIPLTIFAASLWIEAIKAPHEMTWGWSRFFGWSPVSNLQIAIIPTIGMIIYWLIVTINYLSNEG